LVDEPSQVACVSSRRNLVDNVPWCFLIALKIFEHHPRETNLEAIAPIDDVECPGPESDTVHLVKLYLPGPLSLDEADKGFTVLEVLYLEPGGPITWTYYGDVRDSRCEPICMLVDDQVRVAAQVDK
jgi:hypothetical protein